MQENKLSFGKPPKNPLNKRVWRDILRDWKRYLIIFVMLVVTIGFVSGMYVANNSMMHSLENGAEQYNRESGHFELSTTMLILFTGLFVILQLTALLISNIVRSGIRSICEEIGGGKSD